MLDPRVIRIMEMIDDRMDMWHEHKRRVCADDSTTVSALTPSTRTTGRSPGPSQR